MRQGIWGTAWGTPTDNQRLAPFVPLRDSQRGYPSPGAPETLRDPPWGEVGPFGGVIFVHHRPQMSLGAAAQSTKYGQTWTNPIGAGTVFLWGPAANYGPSATLVEKTIFWGHNYIPVGVGLSPLLGPEVMQALLGQVSVEAAIRVG